MKILALTLLPAALLPLLASGPDSASCETSSTAVVPLEATAEPAQVTGLPVYLGDALLRTPCDCPIPLTPIKGTIDKIRANNCFVLDSCGSPSVKIVVQGPIPGASVGQVVALCGTFNSMMCGTDYDGYTFTSASIVTDCDDCP